MGSTAFSSSAQVETSQLYHGNVIFPSYDCRLAMVVNYFFSALQYASSFLCTHRFMSQVRTPQTEVRRGTLFDVHWVLAFNLEHIDMRNVHSPCREEVTVSGYTTIKRSGRKKRVEV